MAKTAFKGIPLSTHGELPQVGSIAPDFALVDKDLHEVKLSDFRGKRVILSIVPSLDTPVCNRSAATFNAKVAKLDNVKMVVISADTPFAQKRTCEAMQNITTLSTMRGKEFAKAYGVLLKIGALAGLCARAVIVIDENGKVIYSHIVSEITHEPPYDDVLASLK